MMIIEKKINNKNKIIKRGDILLNFTKEDYMKEVEGGYITRRVHNEDPDLVILNYTELATYEKRWNNVTLQCRGLIINERTGEVVARPFKKFFNHNEDSGIEYEIPKNEKPIVTVKYDGSLGILYRINNQIRWATRGSFESEQAKIAQEIWDKKYNNVHIPDGLTLLVEIIHPKTRVVVNYNGLEDLIVLAAINRFTGEEVHYDDLVKMAQQWGMKITEKIEGNLEELVKIAKTLDHNNEGFILHWPNNGLRLKVKGDKYLEVHRLLYGLSDKQKVQYWAEDKISELIILVPEEFRKEIEDFKNMCDECYRVIKEQVDDFFELADKSSRKEFAIWVNKFVHKNLHQFMFMKFDNKNIDLSIKNYILKNYRELGLSNE